MRRIIPALAWSACVALGGCSSAPGERAPTAQAGDAAASVSALVDALAARGPGAEVTSDDLDALRRIADREDWRRAMRAIDLPEAEFVRLPVARRDARRQADLDRAGALRRLGRSAAHEISRLRAEGRSAEAAALARAVERLIEANRGPQTLALINAVAEAIERDYSSATP
ncbi:MAG: hypothetical protein D6693_08590 [Planctomycetota bacterium]|nr:MAG: hypothetical protein D6693_08590 [Planctomycetota bacterium]